MVKWKNENHIISKYCTLYIRISTEYLISIKSTGNYPFAGLPATTVYPVNITVF